MPCVCSAICTLTGVPRRKQHQTQGALQAGQPGTPGAPGARRQASRRPVWPGGVRGRGIAGINSICCARSLSPCVRHRTLPCTGQGPGCRGAGVPGIRTRPCVFLTQNSRRGKGQKRHSGGLGSCPRRSWALLLRSCSAQCQRVSKRRRTPQATGLAATSCVRTLVPNGRAGGPCDHAHASCAKLAGGVCGRNGVRRRGGRAEPRA